MQRYGRYFLSFTVLLIVFLSSFLMFSHGNQVLQMSGANLEHITKKINKPNHPDVVYILTISGGGIYGIIPAKILAYLEEKTHKSTALMFDLIIGTSTGALQAAYLTLPNEFGKAKYSAKEMLDLYKSSSKNFFYAPWYHRLLTLNGLLGSKYVNTKRVEFLQKIVKNTRYNQLLSNVVISAYDIQHNMPILFFNWDIKSKYHSYLNENFLVSSLLVAVTSAPAFFPATLMDINHKTYTLVDGALYLDNPSFTGLLLAMIFYPNKKYVLVSLDTGIKKINRKSLSKAGIIEWVLAYLEEMGMVDMKKNNLLMAWLAKMRPEAIEFHSFDVPITNGALDDNSLKNINKISRGADLLIANNRKELDDLAERINHE